MNFRAISCLCAVLAVAPPAMAVTYANDNPFVEAMLRMMAIFGLIDRDSVSLGVPYLPGYSSGMLSGMGGYPGVGMLPGMSPMGPWSGMGGMNGMPGMGAWSTMPGAWPGAALPNPNASGSPWATGMPWTGRPAPAGGRLDGAWELNNGYFILIRGRMARLYVSRERHQDFTIAYDQRHLWWQPQGSKTNRQYQYIVRDGRMILRDTDGKILLLRRKRSRHP